MALGCLTFTLGGLISSCFILETLGVCPPKNAFLRCTCSSNILTCKHLKGQFELERVFSTMYDYSTCYSEFILEDSWAKYLYPEILEYYPILRIRIVNTVLSNIFDYIPPDENKLNHLNLQNVQIKNEFHEEYLQPLKKLETLTFIDTTVPKLGKKFNKYLSDSIVRIILIGTKTESIDYAFAGKFNLDYVAIMRNLLSSINRATFPNSANELKYLSFDGNLIESLDDDQFSQMSKLRNLSLANNKINHVTEPVFGEIFDHLELLDLSGNPIICDCSIQWITKRKKDRITMFGECAAPPDMAGKKIEYLKATDFTSCS